MARQQLRERLRRLIVTIPRSYILRLGRLLGDMWRLGDVPRRRTVVRNLEFTHPHLSRAEIRSLTRCIFQHLGTNLLEISQMGFFSREDILSSVRVAGAEHFRDAMDGPGGVVLISAHLGNWEMALQFAACYFPVPVLTVAKHMRFKPLDRWLTNLRTRLGARVIFKEGAFSEMAKTVRNDGVVILLVDMSRRRDGVDVNFFGRKATATPGAALVALRCNSPVIPGFCFRGADGQLTAQFYPAVSIQRTGDLRSDVAVNTQLITDVLERAIREHIDQWFWYHRKWKKHYPGLYPEFFARKHRKRRRATPADV
jgi:Kdo2-lipid IVA lauroyltransferase/acyltransferase